MTDDAAEPLGRGTQALTEMADLAGDQGHVDNPRRWERLVDQWLAERRALVGSDEGRAELVGLMSDPRPAVRLWSAAAVLFWDPDAARPTLIEIRDAPMTYDLLSITAKHTLRDFEAGALDRDARLPGT